eukprot:6777280-Alexandrium_andersonii.AAC.1
MSNGLLRGGFQEIPCPSFLKATVGATVGRMIWISESSDIDFVDGFGVSARMPQTGPLKSSGDPVRTEFET